MSQVDDAAAHGDVVDVRRRTETSTTTKQALAFDSFKCETNDVTHLSHRKERIWWLVQETRRPQLLLYLFLTRVISELITDHL